MPILVDRCVTYLEKVIDEDNCIKLWHFSEKLQLDKLFEAIKTFVVKNLRSFLMTDEILKLSEDQLNSLLVSDVVYGTLGGFRLTKRACDWRKVHGNITNQELASKMENKLFQASPDPGSDNINSFWAQIDCIEEACFECDLEGNGCPVDECIVVVPQLFGHKGCILCKNEESSKWLVLGDMPTLDYVWVDFAIAVIASDFYFTGGLDVVTRQIESNLCYCFKAAESKWRRCSPMLNSRSKHAAVSVQSKLYVFGWNANVFDGEIYSPSVNQWTKLAMGDIPTYFAPLISSNTCFAFDNSIYFFDFQRNEENNEDESREKCIFRFDVGIKKWDQICVKNDEMHQLCHANIIGSGTYKDYLLFVTDCEKENEPNLRTLSQLFAFDVFRNTFQLVRNVCSEKCFERNSVVFVDGEPYWAGEGTFNEKKYCALFRLDLNENNTNWEKVFRKRAPFYKWGKMLNVSLKRNIVSNLPTISLYDSVNSLFQC